MLSEFDNIERSAGADKAADLRKAHPEMNDKQIAAAAQEQLKAALSPPPAVTKHAKPRPTGASARRETPLPR